MNPAFVVDCSVIMAWCFADETEPGAEKALDRLKQEWAIVPALCPIEVVNVLLVAERRKRITSESLQKLLAFVAALPIATDAEMPLARMPALAALGRSLDVSAYGTAYIELAMRLGLPLATLDRRMQKAAQQSGVTLLLQ